MAFPTQDSQFYLEGGLVNRLRGGRRYPLLRDGSTPHVDPCELKEYTGPGKLIQRNHNTPYNDDVSEHQKRILNGFATITLTENEVVERFIDQKGNVGIEIT